MVMKEEMPAYQVGLGIGYCAGKSRVACGMGASQRGWGLKHWVLLAPSYLGEQAEVLGEVLDLKMTCLGILHFRPFGCRTSHQGEASSVACSLQHIHWIFSTPCKLKQLSILWTINCYVRCSLYITDLLNDCHKLLPLYIQYL